MKNPFHIMIIPTLGCPRKCKYCWSSDVNSPKMSMETVYDIVEWLKPVEKDHVTFTFHGGEPLLAGADFYRTALLLISKELSHMHPEFAMQTNLWLMTDEIADILQEYHIPIGSSIDGPEDLTNYQRGDGYFERCMKGYETARRHGLLVRFICTFTNSSVQRKEDIVRFFEEQGWVMKLHPALPSLKGDNPNAWTLEPEDYGELLVWLLDTAIDHPQFEIMNVNDLCRCVYTNTGSVCTYADCMGSTFAVGPDGAIYPCYRFIGMPEWVMGYVKDKPSLETLMDSPAGRLMTAYKSHVDEVCSGCRHIAYCRGGCPYNALARQNKTEDCGGVDPHCRAYMRIFDEICTRLEREMSDSGSRSAVSRVSRVKRAEPRCVMPLIQRVMEK